MKIHDLAYVLICRPDTETSLLSRITETVNNSSAVITFMSERYEAL